MAPVRQGGAIRQNPGQPTVPVPSDNEFSLVSLSSWEGFCQPREADLSFAGTWQGQEEPFPCLLYHAQLHTMVSLG